MTSSKSTRRALVSSALAILMCVAMLVGSTFAWFTDTASTGVNKIVAGNLDIELQMQDNNGNWVKAEGKTLPFLVEGKIPAEGTQILWEPGCTYYVPAVRVVNKGSLAVKFEYLPEALGVSGKLAEVLELVFKTPEDAEGNEINIEPEILKSGEASPAWSFGYHMSEAAGNEYQNATASGICVTVVATQATYEKDSFDDQYDKNATYPVMNAEGLKEALSDGGSHVLSNDVVIVPEIADKTSSSLAPQVTVSKDTVLDLSDKKIGVNGDEDFGEASPVLMAVTDGTLTINGNGSIDCEAGEQQVYGINVNGGKVVINGGTYYGAITAVQVQKGSLEINGGFFDMAPTCKAQVPQYAKYIVNCIDANYKNGTATISIKGGTFVNFDPSAAPEGAGTSYVAGGYKVISATQTNGDVWYTVVAE